MTVSDLEKILWDTLDINDGVDFDLEALTFKKAEKRPEWADNPDADGAVLVQEVHYTNAYFEGQIRVVRAEDTDAALEALGKLTDALQSMERSVGGLPIPWTPNGSTRTYTWYALLGETPELPTEIDGELFGWFLSSPVVKFKLTCRPFGYRDQRVVLAAAPSTAPLQVVYVDGIEGDVPAEGTLRITDKAAQDRRYVEWGQDIVESAEGNPDLELEADEDLVVEGYMGALAGKTGSTSVKVVQAALLPTAVVLCSTGPISHVGSYRNKLRCQADGDGARFHISYRVGEGNWVTSLPWMTPGQADQWFDLDLGEVFLEEADQGEQVSEIRIEGKVEEGAENCTGWVDVLGLVPTRRYGVAREPLQLDTPTALLGADAFNQSEGNATGKTAEVGGNYSEVEGSDTTDFTVSGGVLKRTAVSDTGTGAKVPSGGRAIGLALAQAPTIAAVDFKLSAEVGAVSSGLMVRTAANGKNRFQAMISSTGLQVAQQHEGVSIPVSHAPVDIDRTQWNRLVLIAEAAEYFVLINGELVLHGETKNLGIAPLNSGNVYLVDTNSGATPCTREYDNLAIWEPDQPIVCASGQSLDIRAEDEERENSAGTFWSPVHYRGAHFLLDPAGNSGLVNRLAVKMRRSDIAGEPDTNLADEQALEVLALERFLAPR